MINETRTLLEQKAKLFLSNNTLVHISLKHGIWKRGIIKEISNDFFMIDESLEGLIPIFFLEIKNIEPKKKLK